MEAGALPVHEEVVHRMNGLHNTGSGGALDAVTSISEIEPGLGKRAYRGYDVGALAERSTYEEVAYLLLYGRLPDAEEFSCFSSGLAKNRELPLEVIEMFRRIPPTAHAMDVLRTAVAFLGMVDPEAHDHSREALFRKAVRTIAKLPTAIAASHRASRGLAAVSPMPQLSHAQNILYMLSGYGPDGDAVNALDTVLILYAEGESDASSFTARVTASSFTDYHSAVTAAIGSLKGRLHGGANEQALRMLLSIGRSDRSASWIKDCLSQTRSIAGFSHGAHARGDGRMGVMKDLSRTLAGNIDETDWHTLCEAVEQVMQREMDLSCTVDFYAASVLHMLGIPAELCTPLFAAGRIAGWSAHIIEQLDNNSVITPRFAYQGPRNLEYPALRRRRREAGGNGEDGLTHLCTQAVQNTTQGKLF